MNYAKEFPRNHRRLLRSKHSNWNIILLFIYLFVSGRAVANVRARCACATLGEALSGRRVASQNVNYVICPVTRHQCSVYSVSVCAFAHKGIVLVSRKAHSISEPKINKHSTGPKINKFWMNCVSTRSHSPSHRRRCDTNTSRCQKQKTKEIVNRMVFPSRCFDGKRLGFSSIAARVQYEIWMRNRNWILEIAAQSNGRCILKCACKVNEVECGNANIWFLKNWMRIAAHMILTNASPLFAHLCRFANVVHIHSLSKMQIHDGISHRWLFTRTQIGGTSSCIEMQRKPSHNDN